MATDPAAPSTAPTPASWAQSLLDALGAPKTPQNVTNIAAWEQAEGTFTRGWHNPLDTTQRAPGSSSVNSVGVQSYPSWQAGIDATVHTLNNGRYGAILGDLNNGNVDVVRFAADVRSTPWGSSTFRPAGSSNDAAVGMLTGIPNPLNGLGDIGNAIGAAPRAVNDAIGHAVGSLFGGAANNAIGKGVESAVGDAAHAIWGVTVRFALVIAGFVLIVVALLVASRQSETGRDVEDAAAVS